MSKSMPRPEPVVVKTVCSLCDEPWEAHGDAPTTLDCIRLLRARPHTTVQYQPSVYPWPYTVNNIAPYVWPGNEITCTIDNLSGITAINTVNPVPFDASFTMPDGSTVEYRTPEVV